jgi:hypothetical protein
MADDILDNFNTTINFLFFDVLLLTAFKSLLGVVTGSTEVLRAAHVLVREIKGGTAPGQRVSSCR